MNFNLINLVKNHKLFQELSKVYHFDVSITTRQKSTLLKITSNIENQDIFVEIPVNQFTENLLKDELNNLSRLIMRNKLHKILKIESLNESSIFNVYQLNIMSPSGFVDCHTINGL